MLLRALGAVIDHRGLPARARFHHSHHRVQKVTAASPRCRYAAELFDLVNKDPERWAVAGNVVDLAQQLAGCRHTGEG